MATRNALETVVAANGRVFISEDDSPTLPTDIDAALSGDFLELGAITEDGSRLRSNTSWKTFGAWHTRFPFRKVRETREATAAFVLRQWNRENFILANGGGTVTTTANGFKYTPPDESAPEDLRALIISWEDGDKHYRVVFPRGMVSEGFEVDLTLTDLSNIPITFEAQPEDDGDEPWYLLTDDPAFDES